MSTRSPQAIEQYLNRFGDYLHNRRRALQLGITDANTLRPAELNKRLAQKLYELGYCVSPAGQLLEQTKCAPARGPVIGQRPRAVTVNGIRYPGVRYAPGYEHFGQFENNGRHELYLGDSYERPISPRRRFPKSPRSPRSRQNHEVYRYR